MKNKKELYQLPKHLLWTGKYEVQSYLLLVSDASWHFPELLDTTFEVWTNSIIDIIRF